MKHNNMSPNGVEEPERRPQRVEEERPDIVAWRTPSASGSDLELEAESRVQREAFPMFSPMSLMQDHKMVIAKYVKSLKHVLIATWD